MYPSNHYCFSRNTYPRKLIRNCIALVFCCALYPATANAFLIWDDFDGDASGWSGNWSTTMGFIVNETGAIQDYSMRLSPQTDDRISSATRRFAPITGDTIYMSVLALNASLTPGTPGYTSGAFDFTLGPTAAPAHPTNLPNWGMFTRRIGFPTVITERKIRLQGVSDDMNATPGNIYQLLTRISKGTDGKFGQVDLWVDPVTEADGVIASRTLTSGVEQVDTFVSYQQNMSGRSYFDEVVIGDSFAEVAWFFRGDSPTLVVGNDVAVSALGGIEGNAGGIELVFDQVTAADEIIARYRRMNAAEADAAFGNALPDFDYRIPGSDVLAVWDLNTQGAEFDTAHLTIHYDDDDLPPTFDEERLALWHYDDVIDIFEPLPIVSLDTDGNTLTVSTDEFSQFVLASAVPLPGGMVLLASALGALTGFSFRRRRLRHPGH